MARYGPPGDPSEQPTRRIDYRAGGQWPPGSYGSDLAAPPGQPESGEPQPPTAPTPWYRKRAVVIGWGLLVVILIALIIYGLIELGTRGGGPAPTQTTTTTPTTTTTTAPTTTTTAPSTTTTEPPSNASTGAPAPPPAAPPAVPHPPAPALPNRPHLPELPRLPRLPSTITLPHTVITLPPGF
ncbi:MAG: hypothetical protein JOZ23_13235 [Mycobacterium sp.]|nr:hypothetical protein [Mycobacterium sp.]MBV9352480.1 hypothetical protein [Mycobacterium sp.]